MIAIENVYISDEVVEEQFVCDLHKCKGGCCIDGDAGAPLTKEELENNWIVPVKNSWLAKRFPLLNADVA